jgi:hypothetical protein
MQYVAAPLAGTLGAPLLAIGPTGPSADDLALLRSLGVAEVLAVGTVPGAELFGAAAIGVDQVVTGDDAGPASQQVAARIARLSDINRTVTVEPAGLSADAAPAAAALAALGGFPLVVGSAAALAVAMPTLYVGPEPADAGLPADRTAAGSLVELSLELADLAATLPLVPATSVALAPAGSSDTVGLVNLGVPIVLHPADRLGAVEGWLQNHALRHGELREVYYTRGPGQLATEEHWRLQGAANGFRVDQLQGRAGQGLPVIRQPLGERPVGRARTDGALDWGSHGPPSYWTSHGQTLRR